MADRHGKRNAASGQRGKPVVTSKTAGAAFSEPPKNNTRRRNVTGRGNAADKAHLEQAWRQAIEDCLIIGIVAVDREGRHTYANRAFRAMTGFGDDELGGSLSPFRYWPPEERDALERTFRKVLSGDCPPEGVEVRLMRRNGQRFDAHILASPLVGIDGNLEGWVASVGDITRRKRDEAAIRESAERLRRLSTELLTAGEKERQRISRDLRDTVGQTISAVKYGIEKAISQLEAGAPRAAIGRQLGESVSLVHDAVDELRGMTYDLRPAVLDDLGIIAAVRWHCRRFQGAHQEVAIRKSIRLAENEVPTRLKIVIYRILQEALNNAVRESGASSLKLSLGRRDDAIQLALEDNGRGVGPDVAGGRMVLASMREWVELSGGELAVESGKEGKGTIIRVSWHPRQLSP